ncbi:type II secretion system protein [Eubacterium limosum]|uniref:type II secretion system protein n=1 Tax=Eubacterium limosum TaxID=1736 RepID=UPI00371669B3
MIQMINKLKKNQKGFTLVELIVVLVILAILAAFTIPAMLGFVDDAKGKAAIATARVGYLGAQSATTESYNASGKIDASNAQKIVDKTKELIKPDINGDVSIGIDADPASLGKDNADDLAFKVNSTTGKVEKVEYVDTQGKFKITITPTASGTSADVTKLQ